MTTSHRVFGRAHAWLVAVVLPAAVFPADAADFDPRRVAADAQWLAFVDIEGLLNSSLGKCMVEHGEALGFTLRGEDFDQLEEQFGIDPMSDVRSVTVYGRGNPEGDGSFFALFETSQAIEGAMNQLTAFAESDAEDAPSLKVIEFGDQKVHVIEHDDESVFFQIRPGRLADDRLLLFAVNQLQMEQGLAVLDGRSPGFALTQALPEGSMVFAACRDMDWAELGLADHNKPASQFLRNATGATLTFGEHDGETFLNLSVDTQSVEHAQNLSDIGRGLIGMARMAGNSDPHLKSIVEPLRSLHIDATESRLSLSLTHNSAKLVEMLQTIAEHSTKMGERGNIDEGRVEIKASVNSKGQVSIDAEASKHKPESR